MTFKFYTLVAYFMISIYMTKYFKSKKSEIEDEIGFKEKDYKKLFEFSFVKEIEVKNHHDDSEEEIVKVCKDDDTKVSHCKEDKKTKSGKFMKRKEYSSQDFLEHYEDRRYTTKFLVYKIMDWWPTIDFIASYGHLFSNLIIVYVAINFNVSLFMGFNLICVCAFYCIATLRL